MTDYTKLVLDQKYSRRGFIAAAGASAFLAACGGSTDSSSDETPRGRPKEALPPATSSITTGSTM